MGMGKKRKFMDFLVIFAALSLFLTGQPLYAMPGTPPPQGKVWVKVDSGWTIVKAPPADAPYIWNANNWEKIKEIPAGKEWVPSYWGKNGWVPAHWCPVIYPHKGAKWVPGYWDTEGSWVQGTWALEGCAPPKDQISLSARIWVPGHRVPGKNLWLHGYWR